MNLSRSNSFVTRRKRQAVQFLSNISRTGPIGPVECAKSENCESITIVVDQAPSGSDLDDRKDDSNSSTSLELDLMSISGVTGTRKRSFSFFSFGRSASTFHLNILNRQKNKRDISSPKPYNCSIDQLKQIKDKSKHSYHGKVVSYKEFLVPTESQKSLHGTDNINRRYSTVSSGYHAKCQNIMNEMQKLAWINDSSIDLYLIAQAQAYFDKLLDKNFINKHNKRLCGGTCLLLSAKLCDVKGEDLKLLIEKIENTFKINKKELINNEFDVLVQLEFSLHLPISEVLVYYKCLSECQK